MLSIAVYRELTLIILETFEIHYG